MQVLYNTWKTHKCAADLDETGLNDGALVMCICTNVYVWMETSFDGTKFTGGFRKLRPWPFDRQQRKALNKWIKGEHK